MSRFCERPLRIAAFDETADQQVARPVLVDADGALRDPEIEAALAEIVRELVGLGAALGVAA